MKFFQLFSLLGSVQARGLLPNSLPYISPPYIETNHTEMTFLNICNRYWSLLASLPTLGSIFPYTFFRINQSLSVFDVFINCSENSTKIVLFSPMCERELDGYDQDPIAYLIEREEDDSMILLRLLRRCISIRHNGIYENKSEIGSIDVHVWYLLWRINHLPGVSVGILVFGDDSVVNSYEKVVEHTIRVINAKYFNNSLENYKKELVLRDSTKMSCDLLYDCYDKKREPSLENGLESDYNLELFILMTIFVALIILMIFCVKKKP